MRSEENLNAQYEIQKQITKLKRGKPIAVAKAKNMMDILRVEKKYNAEIMELKKRLIVVCGVG